MEFFDQVTRYLATKDTHISGIWWERLKEYRLLAGKIELGRWMGPMETANMYNGAKIVINMHRSHNDDTFNNNSAGIEAVSPNPRTFRDRGLRDAAAHGREERPGLLLHAGLRYRHLFDAARNDREDRLLLDPRGGTANIAMRGMIRTMREHTYGKRIERLLGLLFSGMNMRP